MIDLYYAPTPNGWKISIMLEELGVPYTVIPVNIRAGDQFKPDFLAISPNNRIPAIVDHAPAGGGEPFWVFDPFDRQIREGAVRRGSTKEYVRAGREGAGRAEVRYQRPSLRGAKRRSNPYFSADRWIASRRSQ